MPVERGDAVALLRELVRIDSRNPTLVAGAPGEGAVARALAEVLRGWGLDVNLQEVLPGRPNVIARTPRTNARGEAGGGGGVPESHGDGATRSLMFNGHLDVVDVAGMVHAPFEAIEREGRVFGRGASDMKAGVASMCAAAVRAANKGLSGEIVIAAVVDEEFGSAGTRSLLERGVRADAAIVTEPTQLAIMPAHKGFVWLDVVVHGRAAHGSRWELGVDAITLMGLVLAELERLDTEILPARPNHALLGRPSVHASLIEGGGGMSTYPERCTLRIERRTIPGESPEQAEAEVQAACARVLRRRPALRSEVTVTFSQNPSDVPVDAPIVKALAGAIHESGGHTRTQGMSAWTDAALLNEGGIPAICFGPGDISLAHANEEYVDVAEIRRATEVLERLALAWCGNGRLPVRNG